MKVKQLSSVCEIIMGQSPAGSSCNDKEEGYPLVGGASDYGINTPNPKKHTLEPTKLSEIGDIILCIRATIGDINWADKEYCLGRGVTALRPNNKMLYKKYLWYFIGASQTELMKYATGSTFKQINRKIIEEIEIPLPPLETQKQIAQVLETADQLRKDCQQVEQELNTLAQSVFLEMFGDPVTNPKGWKIQNFSELIHSFKYGSSVKSGDQGTPILRIPNVTGIKISLSDLKHVLLSTNELEKNKLINGDILFVRTNGNREYIGRSAVFNLKGVFVYASYLIRARVNEKLVTPYFITALLRTNSGRKMLMKQAKTTAGQFNINTQELGNLKIYIPPLPLQNRFESIFLLIEKQKDENRSKLNQFDDLFNALLQKAFKGELNLKSTEHSQRCQLTTLYNSTILIQSSLCPEKNTPSQK